MLVCPLWVKFRTYTNKRGVRSHTKQTDNISKPDLFTQNTTRPIERVTYPQKTNIYIYIYIVHRHSIRKHKHNHLKQSLQPQTPMQPTTTDLNPVINALRTLQPLLQSITRPTERVTYAQKLKYSAPPQYQKAQTQPLETKSTTTDTNAANYDGFKSCH